MHNEGIPVDGKLAGAALCALARHGQCLNDGAFENELGALVEDTQLILRTQKCEARVVANILWAVASLRKVAPECQVLLEVLIVLTRNKANIMNAKE